MLATTSRSLRRGRRGVILVIVLALLALFAVVGISFVFFSDNEATIARYHKEGETRGGALAPVPDANGAVGAALQNLFFDVGDSNADLANALRGHGLMTAMFSRQQGGLPYNGPGIFHEQADIPGSPFAGFDRAQIVNYTAMHVNGANFVFDPEWAGGPRWVDATRAPMNTWANVPTLSTPFGKVFIPKNAPYTYPDLNNFYLAALSPSTGEVLVPSFYRPWHFNQGNPNPATRLAPWTPGSANTDWVTPEGRARILRPRPVDQLTLSDFASAGLPYPIQPGLANYPGAGQQTALYNLIATKIANGEIMGYPTPNAREPSGAIGYTGDIQNITGNVGQVNGFPGAGVQRNDSILLDIGLPPVQWNNKWIKPLVAMVVADLDGLLNLNAHGNIRNRGVHAGYQGMGPWEVNLSHVLGAEANAVVGARYASPSASAANGVTYMQFDRQGGRLPQSALINWDGSGAASLSPIGPGVLLPGFTAGNPFQVNPAFNGNIDFLTASVPPSTPAKQDRFHDDNVFDGNPLTPPPPMVPSTDAQTQYFEKNANHPSLWNPGDRASPTANQFAQPFTFPLADLRRLRLKYADTRDFYSQMTIAKTGTPPNAFLVLGNPAMYPSGPLYRNDPVHANRHLVTTLSAGLDRASLMPMFRAAGPGAAAQLAGTHTTLPAGYSGPWSPTPVPGAISDFANMVDARNFRAALGGLDLNRPLSDPRDLNNFPNVDGPGDPNPMAAGDRTPQPLDPSNMALYAQAWADRHNLAKDIFARLIVATGAAAYVDPSSGSISFAQYNAVTMAYELTTPGGTVSFPTTPVDTYTPHKNALRYLAQLAANIVDTIDKDDISTVFVWQPLDPTPGPTLGAPIALANVDATTVQAIAALCMATPPFANVPERVVFGTERSRLVLNEAYGEANNNPADFTGMTPATNPMHVRFWVELLNPTSNPYPAGTIGGMLGDGSAPLWYTSGATSYSPYKVVIVRDEKPGVPGGVGGYLRTADNVTGEVGPATFVPDIAFDFNVPGVNGGGGVSRVVPNNGQYSGYPALPGATATPGFIVLGPPALAPAMPTIEFDPTTLGGPWAGMIQSGAVAAIGASGANSMGYIHDSATVPPATDLEAETTVPGGKLRKHTVVLRRLANPYLPPSGTNPFITVDTMERVPAYDAVRKAGAVGTPRTAKAAPGGVGHDKAAAPGMAADTRPQAIGRVQPYAGLTTGNDAVAGMAGSYTSVNSFPYSFTVPQNPTTVAASNVRETFFRHNGRNSGTRQIVPPATTPQPFAPEPEPTTGTVVGNNPAGMPPTDAYLTDGTGPPFAGGGTLMAPFDWLVHYDRPLVNPLELLHVQAVKSHEVTQAFLQPPTAVGQPVRRDMGLAPWLGVNAANSLPTFGAAGLPIFDLSAGPQANVTNNGLFRAFELLRVKSLTYGAAAGGRVYGKVNVNTIQDYRVLLGLLDPQAGNVFGAADVYDAVSPGNPTTIWGRWIASRTPNLSNRYLANGTTYYSVPVPGKTLDDDPYDPAWFTLDRPFKGFGVGELGPTQPPPTRTAGGGSAAATVPNPMAPPATLPAPFGPGFQDTILRAYNGAPTAGVPAPGQPNLWIANAAAVQHPYLQAEAARKLQSNATTVSNVFAVHITVVFHEVRQSGGTLLVGPESAVGVNRFLLGKEVFRETPGDTRQQYFAVVDRSNVHLQPNTTLLTTDPNFNNLPFFSAVESSGPAPTTPPPSMPPFLAPLPTSYNVYLANAIPTPAVPGAVPFTTAVNAYQLIVYSDGQPVAIGPGMNLMFGTGSNQEVVTVNYVNQDGSLNVNGPLTSPAVLNQMNKVHAQGDVVSNGVPGNPGIPGVSAPVFDRLTNQFSIYRPMVPYVVKVK